MRKRWIGIAILLVVAFFGLKGWVRTLWTPAGTVETYSIEGRDGRSMMMVFFPNHDTMIWYGDPKAQRIEGVLTRMRGSYGTHYFWRLWHVEGIYFGYRIYPSGMKPVRMEIEVLEKFVEGRGNSSFPEKGRTTHSVMLFGKDMLEFDGTSLYLSETDEPTVKALLERLGGPRGLPSR